MSLHHCNILDLNDDCLIYLYDKLPLSLQINVALTCQRFQNLYNLRTAPAFKKIILTEMKSFIDNEQFCEFFKATGRFIEEVDASYRRFDNEFFTSLCRYASNLKSVNMRSTLFIDNRQLANIFGQMQMVEELDLSFCSLTDENVRDLEKFQRLRVLRLEGNNDLTGQYLAILNKLEELDLNSCSLEAKHCLDIADCLTELRIFKIYEHQASATLCQRLTENCLKLEILHLSCGPDHSSKVLAQLPCLQQLAALEDAQLELLEALTLYKAAQLTHLEIETDSMNELEAKIKQVNQLSGLKTLHWYRAYFTDAHLTKLHLNNLEYFVAERFDGVTNAGLLSLLHNCPNLQSISVKFGRLITETFILDAIELLESRKKPTKKTLLVEFYSTAVQTSILEDPRYIAGKMLLELRVFNSIVR